MASEKKKQQVARFTELLNGKSLIFFNYQGISVTDLTAIRNKMREEGGLVKVIKKNLLKLSLKNNKELLPVSADFMIPFYSIENRMNKKTRKTKYSP